MDALKELLTADVASFYVQQPNFYGLLEDAEALGALSTRRAPSNIMGCHPIALAILKSPCLRRRHRRRRRAAVGDALGSGGPYLGYMAATQKLMKAPRPYRGETTDARATKPTS